MLRSKRVVRSLEICIYSRNLWGITDFRSWKLPVFFFHIPTYALITRILNGLIGALDVLFNFWEVIDTETLHRSWETIKHPTLIQYAKLVLERCCVISIKKIISSELCFNTGVIISMSRNYICSVLVLSMNQVWELLYISTFCLKHTCTCIINLFYLKNLKVIWKNVAPT